VPLPVALAILLIPSSETSRPVVEILAGVALTAAGEAIRLWGVGQIGVISRTRSGRLGPLVDTGPFAYVRNPLYAGNILLWVGFAVTAGLLWLAPLVVVLLALEYHRIVAWEESRLLAHHGDTYRDYSRRVPRWLPRAGSGAGSRQPGAGLVSGSTLAHTLFSERGTLVAIAAGYVLLWLRARF